MSLPSGSRIHRASICAAAGALPQTNNVNAYADSGTVRHEFMRAYLAEGVEAALAAAPDEHRAALESIDVAVFERFRGLDAELALAYDAESEVTRIIGVNVGREYGPLGPTEVPMSLDLSGVVGGVAHCHDLKTGRAPVPPPSRNLQVRLGALAVARLHGIQSARAGILTMADGSAPRHEVDDLDAWALDDVAAQVRAVSSRVHEARAKLSVGLPIHPTTGEHCLYCPARLACPAQMALGMRLVNTPADVASELASIPTSRAWVQIKVIKQLIGDAEGAIRMAAREAPIDLGDGRWLGEQTSSRESIDGDKAWSVLFDALGPDAVRAAVDVEVSKASVGRGARVAYEARKAAGEKVTIKAIEGEALAALRRAGAITAKTTTRIEEYEE